MDTDSFFFARCILPRVSSTTFALRHNFCRTYGSHFFEVTAIQSCSQNVGADADQGKFKQYERTVCIYLTLPLVVIGIAVNVAVVYLLRRDKTLRTINRFLLRALSITDIIFLLTCVTSDVIPTVVRSTDWVSDTVFERLWNNVASHLWPAKHVALIASTWLIVAITFDQYSSTRTTGWSRSNLCGTLSAARLTGDLAVYCIWIGSIVFNLPRFFYLNGAIYVFFYDLVGHVFVAILLPGVLIGCLGWRLVGRLRLSSKPSDDDNISRSLDASPEESKPSSETGSQDRRQTISVLVIVGVMFACRAPGIVSFVYGFPFRLELSWSGSYEEEFAAFECFIVLTDFLLVVNSASRFVDYMMFRRWSVDCDASVDWV